MSLGVAGHRRLDAHPEGAAVPDDLEPDALQGDLWACGVRIDADGGQLALEELRFLGDKTTPRVLHGGGALGLSLLERVEGHLPDVLGLCYASACHRSAPFPKPYALTWGFTLLAEVYGH